MRKREKKKEVGGEGVEGRQRGKQGKGRRKRGEGGREVREEERQSLNTTMYCQDRICGIHSKLLYLA